MKRLLMQSQTKPSLLFPWLVAVLWLMLPLLAWHIVSVWTALPREMVTHFDANGRPNGWQSPAQFAVFAPAFLLFELSIMSFAMHRACRVQSMWRSLTIIAYLAVGICFMVFWQVLDHAAYGVPMTQVWPSPAIMPVAALVFAVIALCSVKFGDPGQSRGPHVLIAEEQHRSLLQLLLVVPGMGIGGYLWISNPTPLRYIGIFLLAVMSWIAVAVLDGFHYLVRTDGIQIRGFLLPLRFVPRSAIRSYRADRWKGLGYGIRLTSTGTAYIWGGRDVVNIVTDSGDVMLGHSEPERLIRDLDQMMQTTHTAQ